MSDFSNTIESFGVCHYMLTMIAMRCILGLVNLNDASKYVHVRKQNLIWHTCLGHDLLTLESALRLQLHQIIDHVHALHRFTV